MKNVFGILNLHDGPSLGELTEEHPLGSISFLGRYGLMDFALSNLTNSGVDRIAILIEKNSHSIRSHLQGGNIWISNTKTGNLGEYLNEKVLSTPSYNTDIANLRDSLSPIDRQIVEDYVLIVPPHFVMCLDFNEVVENHIASGSDITIVYSPRKDAKKEFINSDTLSFDKDGNVISIEKNKGDSSAANISLETYVINKSKLVEIVNLASKKSKTATLRSMISSLVEEGKIIVKGYAYHDLVLPITSLQNYVKYSFMLLKEEYSNLLFKKDWPIYTTTHNTAPTIYGKNAEVSNSFIANGSRINGKVENSIISRNVVVEEGAYVKDSIIFTKTSIASGSKVKYILAGKHVDIRNKKNVSGTKEEILFINYGAKI